MEIDGGTLDSATLELIAKEIHRRYLRAQRSRGVETGAAMVAWESLPEDLREANRAQAGDIVAKLARIGCSVHAGPSPRRFVLRRAELELLAAEEHDRWAAQRREAGWVFGPVRDDTLKHHPLLVSWEELAEEEREKDRDAVRNMRPVLAAVGLHIERD